MKELKNSFWNGVMLMMCMVGLFQDFLGLENYLRFVVQNWWDIPWGLWLIPMIIIFYLQYRAEKRAAK